MKEPPAPDLPPLESEEFLPPVSRWMRLGGFVLSGTLGGMLFLAAVTRYDVTVQAIASVRPAGDLSIVQAAAEGTVNQVNVRQNQVVRQGDVIAEINVLDRARLRNLQARKSTLQGYVRQYKQQLAQVNGQLQTLDEQILAQSELPPLAGASVQVGRPPSPDELVNVALEFMGRSRPGMAAELSNSRDNLLKNRAGLQSQIQYDQETLQEVTAEIDKQIVRAPTDGIILRLDVQNPGQPIRLGDPIAQIVPQNAPLVAKGRVAVQDISQVSLGQMAQLRITAYPYPDYGALTGKVQAIAPDVTTIRDPDGTILTFYEVTIQPDHPYLTRANRQYPIHPGMEARVDIISHQETLLQFLLRKARLWADV